MPSTRPLPPLTALRAFEAAARHLSFSQAAQELFVTQSAVSHHIHKLESEMGVTLFERRTRAVALTTAGQAYFAKVHAAFELLRTGTEETRAPTTARIRLTVGLLASFATRWLAPRLQAFSAAHPGIELQLRPDIALADVPGGEVDLAIRYGRGGWADVRARKLMPERLSVVCSPTLLGGTRRPRKPQDLVRYPLLASHAKLPFEWQAWGTRFGVDLRGAQTVHLHDYNIVVEAALAGQGIAMGRHRLIAPQLASGALVQAVPDAVLDDPRIGWWLITPRAAKREIEAVTVFRDWLMQTAARDPIN